MIKLKEFSKWQIFSLSYAIISTIGILVLFTNTVIQGNNIWTKFFRYWTYQSNILLTVVFWIQAFKKDEWKFAKYFKVAVYAFVGLTGVIYWAVLFPTDTDIASSWNKLLGAILLHSLTPAVGVIEFFVWWKKNKPTGISYKGMLPILGWVAIYTTIGLVDFAVTGKPVYFFFNYNNVGTFFMWLAILVVAISGLVFLGIYLIKRNDKK